MSISSQLNFKTIKKRSIKGVFTLSMATFLLQVIALIATFLLTVFLTPAEYGVFFVVSAIVNFLVYFSDIGLAAALIQKKQKVTCGDLKTTFTIQQTLVIFLVILSLSISGRIGKFYNLSVAGLWLFRFLIISFFLSSLKTIPSIILERGLKFNKLIIPQIVESLFFYCPAVFLAWRGWGVKSFSVAVLLRGFSGLVTIYLLVPWRPTFGIIRTSARKLLSFGVPFQANSLLALVKDDLLSVFLGKILPFSQIGFIGWAQKWAYFPLRFFMDSVNKVAFPSFSRLQEEKVLLKKAIEKVIYFIALLIFPILTGLLLGAPYFIRFFPKYQKWQPALLLLTFFCFSAIISSLTTTLSNVLSATGKIRIVLKLMVAWTFLTWLLTISLVFKFGYKGVAVAAFLVALISTLTIYIVKKEVDFCFFKNIAKPLLATIIMTLAFTLLVNFAQNLLSLAIIIVFAGIIYLLAMLLMDKKRLFNEVRLILISLKT